jgi:hypothetical protein
LGWSAHAVTADDYKNGVAPCMRVRAKTQGVEFLTLSPRGM